MSLSLGFALYLHLSIRRCPASELVLCINRVFVGTAYLNFSEVLRDIDIHDGEFVIHCPVDVGLRHISLKASSVNIISYSAGHTHNPCVV